MVIQKSHMGHTEVAHGPHRGHIMVTQRSHYGHTEVTLWSHRGHTGDTQTFTLDYLYI